MHGAIISLLSVLLFSTSVYNPGQADAMVKLNALTNQETDPYQKLDSRKLTGFMFQNLSNTELGNDKDIVRARLAHLVTAAIAELRLRYLAKQDPEAAILVKQLDEMKKCEKDLF